MQTKVVTVSRERMIYYLVEQKIFDHVIKNASSYIMKIRTLPERSLDIKVGNYTHKEWID